MNVALNDIAPRSPELIAVVTARAGSWPTEELRKAKTAERAIPAIDPRDVFMRNLDLPRGREREIVRDPRERGGVVRLLTLFCIFDIFCKYRNDRNYW